MWVRNKLNGWTLGIVVMGQTLPVIADPASSRRLHYRPPESAFHPQSTTLAASLPPAQERPFLLLLPDTECPPCRSWLWQLAGRHCFSGCPRLRLVLYQLDSSCAIRTVFTVISHLDHPIEVHGGADNHLQSMEDPTPEQVDAQRRL
ncbi:hypothetical protein QYF61_005656 [Mycteria americana]|uniref:Uncharacterized protein n=1 Tax=Mycteria americana TaxID=33587 RepID=A0AAN7S0F7_MYCAM|nr:hypothetical protein QYF61_005656 [Mycteria americana]